jgi:methyl-accepting chemotaxis protein
MHSGRQSTTGEAVKAIKEIGLTIDQISAITAAITAAVEQQTMATREISRKVHEARYNTKLVANDITQVNTGATETGTASSEDLSVNKPSKSDPFNARQINSLARRSASGPPGRLTIRNRLPVVSSPKSSVRQLRSAPCKRWERFASAAESA